MFVCVGCAVHACGPLAVAYELDEAKDDEREQEEDVRKELEAMDAVPTLTDPTLTSDLEIVKWYAELIERKLTPTLKRESEHVSVEFVYGPYAVPLVLHGGIYNSTG